MELCQERDWLRALSLIWRDWSARRFMRPCSEAAVGVSKTELCEFIGRAKR